MAKNQSICHAKPTKLGKNAQNLGGAAYHHANTPFKPKAMFGFLNIFGKKSQNLAAPITQTDKKRLSAQLKNYTRPRVELGLEVLESAVRAAEDPLYADYTKLWALYDKIAKDSHLRSQMRTAIYTVVSAPWELAGADAKLLQKEWFVSFLKMAMSAEFYSHALIEFGQLENGQFSECKIFNRNHILPTTGEIVYTPGNRYGVPYREFANDYFLIEITGDEALGTFESAAHEVILKSYGRSDWSRGSERFGQPFLVVKTSTQDETEIDRMEEMARNFGTSGYMIVDEDDNVDLKETSRSDFYKIYDAQIRYADESISKLINGQTMTSDNGASLAQGQVHERILNEYTRARLRNLQAVVNDKLLPFLRYHGYQIGQEAKFEFVELREKRATTPQAKPTPTTPEKKKPNPQKVK